MNKNIIIIAIIVLILAISVFSLSTKEYPSPSDWVKESQIKVYPNQIILNIENANWAKFTDTNSMDPFLDETSNAIEILPQEDQIKAGDIISYRLGNDIIIHRVQEIGEDKKGTYYLVQGDNNSLRDPFKVRYNQITGVVVAIIY